MISLHSKSFFSLAPDKAQKGDDFVFGDAAVQLDYRHSVHEDEVGEFLEQGAGSVNEEIVVEEAVAGNDDVEAVRKGKILLQLQHQSGDGDTYCLVPLLIDFQMAGKDAADIKNVPDQRQSGDLFFTLHALFSL